VPEAPVADKPVVVQAAAPLIRDVDVTLTYPFEIEADRSVSITPVAINGFLTKVAVDVGDEVRSGQLIALVDCREYTAQRTQAETAIEKREARVDESRSQLERLGRMGDGLVAPAELERAQAESRVAEAELADARAKLSEAQQRKGYCSLRAPFDGFVSERFLDPGAMVSPGGLPVVNLVKTREVRGVASVIESDAPRVLRDAEVKVKLSAFPETTFEAKVARFGHSLDPHTRTMRVEMDIPNAKESFLPGMTGIADIVVDRRESAMLLPVTAMLNLEDVVYAYIVTDEDGKPRAKRVEVELGVDLGDWIEVRKGIAPTDSVIMVGRELVDDGTWVEVQPPGEDLPPSPESDPPPQAEQADPGASEAREGRNKPAKAGEKEADSEEDGTTDGAAADDPAAADTEGERAPDGADAPDETAKAAKATKKAPKPGKPPTAASATGTPKPEAKPKAEAPDGASP